MQLRQGLQGRSKILDWSRKYPVNEDICIENLVCGVQERENLTKCELIKVAKWKVEKGRNTVWRVKETIPDDVEEITGNAFQLTDHKESIRYLRCLDGVGRAVASAILHWFHECPYPIWDIYARWSVSLNECWDQYRNNDERWEAYVEFCRGIADRYEVDMRTLDRALFKYGEAKMPRTC